MSSRFGPVHLRNAREKLEDQETWMRNHGGDLAGYRRHYKPTDGDGPDAIFAADYAHLQELIERVQDLEQEFG
jgi:hypothetical protein